HGVVGDRLRGLGARARHPGIPEAGAVASDAPTHPSRGGMPRRGRYGRLCARNRRPDAPHLFPAEVAMPSQARAAHGRAARSILAASFALMLAGWTPSVAAAPRPYNAVPPTPAFRGYDPGAI